MRHAPFAALLATALAGPLHAATVTQWNFNSTTPDAATGTGSSAPSLGTGTLVALGGVTQSFASGAGSTDPELSDDSGLNITTFAAQGAENLLRGVSFAVSTVGFEAIKISYDTRHSNTASRYQQVQYTLDGSTFTNIALFDIDVGSAFFLDRTVDLSSIAGASNNASFAFRVVSSFAPGTSAYAPTTGTSYGTAGTWRFDMVTVSGTAIAAVPEPGAAALLLAGLGVVVMLSRRRRHG